MSFRNEIIKKEFGQVGFESYQKMVNALETTPKTKSCEIIYNYDKERTFTVLNSGELNAFDIAQVFSKHRYCAYAPLVCHPVEAKTGKMLVGKPGIITVKMQCVAIFDTDNGDFPY